ncbi:MAG: sulfite exporter TauE/SafE family protein [Bacillota bacterium]
MINWMITLLSFLVIIIGTLVHGIAGFGLAQVAMGLMPLFRSPKSASIIFSLIAVLSNLRIWWSVREHFEVRDWSAPVAGLIVGMPIGIYFFSSLNSGQLRIAIAITLFIAVILIALMKQLKFLQQWLSQTSIEPDWKTGILAGFAAGILGGAVAIPGPPMIIYGTFMVATGIWQSKRMKAVFTAFFGTLMLYRFLSLAINGVVTTKLMLETLIILPGLFIGAWLGIKVYNHIPEKIFSWIVLLMLTINAFILLITA